MSETPCSQLVSEPHDLNLRWKDNRTHPKGHTNTSLRRKTTGRNIIVHLSLNRRLRRSRGSIHPHIQLSISNIHTQSSKALQSVREFDSSWCNTASARRGRLRGEMCLKSDAMNWSTLRLDVFDDALGSGGFDVGTFEAVVVVEEFGFW